MRDHIICILHHARTAMPDDAALTLDLLASIEVEAMAALHGGKTIIPSELFGEITIPQNVIIDMSNGESDLWFSVDKYIDVNIFYTSLGWGYTIHPVKNGQTDSDNPIDKGQL